MFMEEKSSRYPIGQNESNGCNYVGFSIRKSCTYTITKGRVLTAFFTPFL